MTKYYYTFPQILDLAGFMDTTDFVDTWFDDWSVNDRALILKLVNRFYTRGKLNYFQVTKEELPRTGYHTTNKLILFVNVIQETADEYLPIIKLQTANINNIGDAGSATSVTTFNDTPQNTGDYTDDTHMSTYTRNVNTATLDTASKLAAAKEAVKDYYEEWYNKYLKKFIIIGA